MVPLTLQSWHRTLRHMIMAGMCTLLGVITVILIQRIGFIGPAALIAVTAVLVCGFLFAEVTVGILLAAVVLFPSEQLFTYSIPLFGGGLKPTDLLLLITLSGFAIRQVFQRRSYPALPGGATTLVLCFVGWAVFSAVLGINRGIFYKDSLVELRPILQYLLFVPISVEFTQT